MENPLTKGKYLNGKSRKIFIFRDVNIKKKGWKSGEAKDLKYMNAY
ncbi:MAG: hypothetical protein AB3K77_03240 [Methanosarcinaceae archaeon]